VKFVRIVVSLGLLTTQANASTSDLFGARGVPDCRAYALYLDHPSLVNVELQHQLSLIDAVAEATGLPRGSFKSDFASACRENQNLTVDEVIKSLFDKYRGK
jgi:hypothetical protein